MGCAVAFAVALGAIFGYLCLLATIGTWLYDANAPDAWVRPSFWQWVGLAFLAQMIWFRLGGPFKVDRSK